jgi:hypothetical protein
MYRWSQAQIGLYIFSVFFRYFNKGQAEVEKHQTFVENLGVQLKEIKQSQNLEKTKLQELQTSLKNSMGGYKEVRYWSQGYKTENGNQSQFYNFQP